MPNAAARNGLNLFTSQFTWTRFTNRKTLLYTRQQSTPTQRPGEPSKRQGAERRTPPSRTGPFATTSGRHNEVQKKMINITISIFIFWCRLVRGVGVRARQSPA